MQNEPESSLKNIPIHDIVRNDENPRLFFRQQELDELLDSILKMGVLVPISVYRDGNKYVLIDGERRWRCCQKLNRKSIPALIQPKPSKLNNILTMFNIHALREQWDLLTIALKLRDVISLYKKENKRPPTEIDLSRETGLSRGVIRRCKHLLALPDKYHLMLKAELSKPKKQQKLTEDFFIEMEKALRTVELSMPEVIPDKDKVRKVLIKKFRDGKTITNRVEFRKVAKIARAGKVGAAIEPAQKALQRLFSPNKYGIETAYQASVADEYTERDLSTRTAGLIDRLQGIDPEDIDEDFREILEELNHLIDHLLEVES